MDSVPKSFALILIGLMAISCLGLLMIESAKAQSTSTPSAPEFTVKVSASSLELTIKNQPITEYTGNVSNPSLYYGFRFKDHANFQDWNYAPLYYVLPSTYGTYYKASASDYTIVSFTVGNYPLKGILDSGQVDMQVVALVGNEIPTNYENGTVYTFDGVSSVWSNTQTITTTIYDWKTQFTIIPIAVILILTIIGIIAISVLLIQRHRKIAKLNQ
jgi:hypothetical protein